MKIHSVPINPFQIVSTIEMSEVEDVRFEVRGCLTEGHKALFSATSFRPGEAMVPFGSSATHSRPDRYTVQTGSDHHIILEPEFLLYLNHHCSPNTFLDLRRMMLRAIAPISEGDELTFFYPSTEWSMSDGFECHCGSPRCLGRIRGAAHLDDGKLSSYDLSDHIRLLLRERSSVSRKLR
jgi:hypothetical protein